jgi:hypothetical protein
MKRRISVEVLAQVSCVSNDAMATGLLTIITYEISRKISRDAPFGELRASDSLSEIKSRTWRGCLLS